MSEERAEYKTNRTLTIDEAAEILGQPIYTVRRHIKAGRLPAEKVEQHKKGSAPFRWEIKEEDVMKLKEELEQGQVVKLGRPPSEKSLKRGEDYTYIYHPRSDEYVTWLTNTLTPEERAAILDYFARLKETDPEKFERMLKEIK
jgi:excisionase family DNA binding protein